MIGGTNKLEEKIVYKPKNIELSDDGEFTITTDGMQELRKKALDSLGRKDIAKTIIELCAKLIVEMNCESTDNDLLSIYMSRIILYMEIYRESVKLDNNTFTNAIVKEYGNLYLLLKMIHDDEEMVSGLKTALDNTKSSMNITTDKDGNK